VSGKIGATPDRTLVGDEECSRSRLPDFLDQLTFELPRQAAEQNFFHLGEFFITDGDVRSFFERRCPNGLQILPVKTTTENDGETAAAYWAIKVIRKIDCIDPALSLAARPMWSNDLQPFAELMTTYSLVDSLKLNSPIRTVTGTSLSHTSVASTLFA
jgi:hypothetical protein